MDLESFWSWGTLTTFAGATACTGLFTQMLKNIVGKLPTQWLSYIIAVVLLVVTTAATGGWAQPWTVWGIGADECGFGQFGQQRRRGCNALDERQKSP